MQMLNPGTAKTFQEYADNVLSSYVASQLEAAQCHLNLGCVHCRQLEKLNQGKMR